MNNVDKDFFKNSRQLSSSGDIDDVDRSMFLKSQKYDEGYELENPQNLGEFVEELERFQNESPYEKTKRLALSHAERAFEGLTGFYGNMQELASALTGISIPEREIPTREELMSFHIPSIESMEGGNFSYRLPTTQDIREQSKETFGHYLEPKTEMEKASQEYAEDVGAMFAVPGNMNFFQKLLFPAIGQTSKQIAKGLGLSEKSQNIAKLGAMVFASLFNLGNAPRVASQALNEAENLIQPGLSFAAHPIETGLNNVRNSLWYRSGRTLEKGPAMDFVDRIQSQIRNGQIEGRMTMQLRRDLNSIRKNLGAFEVPFTGRGPALRYLNQVDDALIAGMENYGNQINPIWWNQYRLANEAFRVTSRSQSISQYIHDHGGRKALSDTAKFLFFPALQYAGYITPATVSVAGAGLLGMKSIQIANRVLRSEILRNHYMDVVRRASVGNAKQVHDAIKRFDKAALQEENQSKKSPKKKSPII